MPRICSPDKKPGGRRYRQHAQAEQHAAGDLDRHESLQAEQDHIHGEIGICIPIRRVEGAEVEGWIVEMRKHEGACQVIRVVDNGREAHRPDRREQGPGDQENP